MEYLKIKPPRSGEYEIVLLMLFQLFFFLPLKIVLHLTESCKIRLIHPSFLVRLLVCFGKACVSVTFCFSPLFFFVCFCSSPLFYAC